MYGASYYNRPKCIMYVGTEPVGTVGLLQQGQWQIMQI